MVLREFKVGLVFIVKEGVYVASFPGLQSPNTVEGLVKLLCRMTSGRRWVDVGRHGTSGEVQSAAQ